MPAPTVLIVDDEPQVLELVSRLLIREGYHVLTAPDARAAIEIAKGCTALDVVLSDVIMPGMHGPELINEIIRASPSTSAILMSGYVAEVPLPPEVPFLQKPLVARELLSLVEAAVGGSREVNRRERGGGGEKERRAGG